MVVADYTGRCYCYHFSNSDCLSSSNCGSFKSSTHLVGEDLVRASREAWRGEDRLLVTWLGSSEGQGWGQDSQSSPRGPPAPHCPGLPPAQGSRLWFCWGEVGAAGVGLGLVLTQGACSEGATGDRGWLYVLE